MGVNTPGDEKGKRHCFKGLGTQSAVGFEGNGNGRGGVLQRTMYKRRMHKMCKKRTLIRTKKGAISRVRLVCLSVNHQCIVLLKRFSRKVLNKPPKHLISNSLCQRPQINVIITRYLNFLKISFSSNFISMLNLFKFTPCLYLYFSFLFSI